MTDDIHWSLAEMLGPGDKISRLKKTVHSFDFSSRALSSRELGLLSAPYLIFGPKNDPIFIWVVSPVTRDETRGHVSNYPGH